MPIEISVPGSKSIANRVLALSALHTIPLRISNIPDCDDCKYMLAAIQKLGTEVEQKNNTFILKNFNNKDKTAVKLYTGNAGTTTRFLTAISTTFNREITISGNDRMAERPISILTKALNKIGAKVSDTNNCPPVKIKPQPPYKDKISLPGNISSQYITALIILGTKLEKGLTINIEQELCSKPYIDITLQILKKFNFQFENKDYKKIIIHPNSIKYPSEFIVESDASSASYPGAFAALNSEKTIQLNNISKNSIQGDIKFLKLLEQQNCTIKQTQNSITIQGPKELKSLGKIDMNEIPDLVMTFAILAMFTEGKTTITNVYNLRIKETDRLEALENEIKKFGINVKTGKDFIEIIGNPKLKENKEITNKEIEIETYDDHRIAMSFGIIRQFFPKMKILNPECVSKSYPTFWQDLEILEKEKHNKNKVQ